MNAILQVDQLSKTYAGKNKALTVLNNISFSIPQGHTFSIIGPSGSGKTTLLGLCAGLDQASSGKVLLKNIDLTGLNEDERAQVRNQHVGFIFQSFQLLPTLTALENVMVPLELQGVSSAKARKAAKEQLNNVGLGQRMQHYPQQLSGGEQQRVAIARAFVNNPALLFADEPTGNLDEETSDRITELLFNLNKQAGTTLVLVTHNPELAALTQRTIRIKGGQLVEDISR